MKSCSLTVEGKLYIMKLNKGKPFKNHWQFLAVVKANPWGGGGTPL